MGTHYLRNLFSQGICNTNTMKDRCRRRKKHEINLRYKCGCGKTYGSNTALYIHIKIKHRGYPPPETVTPGSIKFAKKQKENP